MLVTSGRKKKEEGQSAKETARPVFKKAPPEAVSRDFCLYYIGWNRITWPPYFYSSSLGRQVSLCPTSILGKGLVGQVASLQYLPPLTGAFSLPDTLSHGILSDNNFSVQKFQLKNAMSSPLISSFK